MTLPLQKKVVLGLQHTVAMFGATVLVPLLTGLTYRRGGAPVPIGQATAVYEALQRTPFASLYGSSNWHDDLAELVAWSHLTGRMGQPYRIVVREAGRDLFTYEPMASPRVRRRLPLLTRFYGDAPRG